MFDEVTCNLLHSLLNLLPSAALSESPHKGHVEICNTGLKMLVDGLNFLCVSVVKDFLVDWRTVFLLNGLI